MKTFIAYFYYWTPGTEDEHHHLSAAVGATDPQEALQRFRRFLRKQYENIDADNAGLLPSGATVFLDAMYELSALRSTPVILDWQSVRYAGKKTGAAARTPYFLRVNSSASEALQQPNPTVQSRSERKSKRKPFLVFPDLR